MVLSSGPEKLAVSWLQHYLHLHAREELAVGSRDRLHSTAEEVVMSML